MEAWPTILPRPNTAYSIQPDSQVVSNSFEAGPPVQRLRFDDEIDFVSLSWDLSDYQFAMFKEWFATKLAFGTKKFTMLIPLGGLGGDQEYECEFNASGRPYSATYKTKGYWVVTANLFVEEVEFLDEEVLGFLLNETDDQFVTVSSDFDDFTENTFPTLID